MGRIPSFLITGAVSGMLLFVAGAASNEPSVEPSDMEQLRQEVAALRQRIETLEKRLNDAVIVLPKWDGKRTPPLIDPHIWPRIWPHQIPKDWKPFEFNGMPFYVIPIGNAIPSPTPPQE